MYWHFMHILDASVNVADSDVHDDIKRYDNKGSVNKCQRRHELDEHTFDSVVRMRLDTVEQDADGLHMVMYL